MRRTPDTGKADTSMTAKYPDAQLMHASPANGHPTSAKTPADAGYQSWQPKLSNRVKKY